MTIRRRRRAIANNGQWHTYPASAKNLPWTDSQSPTPSLRCLTCGEWRDICDTIRHETTHAERTESQ